jgi:hypothetical protein
VYGWTDPLDPWEGGLGGLAFTGLQISASFVEFGFQRLFLMFIF